METRISRSKRIRANWEEFESRIDRMEDDFVEQASLDSMKLARSLNRSANPYKSLDSVSDADRFAQAEEFMRIYGDGLRGEI